MIFIFIVILTFLYIFFLFKNLGETRNISINNKSILLTLFILFIFIIMIFLGKSNIGYIEEYNKISSKHQEIRNNINTIRKNIPSLEQKLNNNPNNFEGWVMLGKSYIIISDFHSAALAYETAITLDNTDKTVLQDFISLLRRLDSKNNKDKILRAFDILIALDKSDINSFNMKLNYSIDINDSEMTKNILRKIIINKNIKDKKPYETMLNKLTNTDK
jgi:tetratricopeptide (TPR) repeat protein